MLACRALACAALTLAIWLPATAAGPNDAQKMFSVCLDDDNPPFSAPEGKGAAGGGGGINVELAQALAQHLGRTLRIAWVSEPNRGGFGKALRQSIDSGKCEAFVGVPSSRELSDTLREHDLVTSRPYLTAGYVFASRAGSAPASAQDARRARRIGVTSATPADLYLYAKGFNRVPYANTAAVLQALAHGEVDLGMVWTPAAASLSAEGRTDWVLSPEPSDDASLRTPLAIALRRSDASLLGAVNEALGALISDGTVARIATEHRLFALQP